MARSFQAQQIADQLLDESDGYDIRLLNRRDGTVDVAVMGPRRAVKLGKVRQRGNAWKITQVLHDIGRAGRCRMDGYFGSAQKAASCLALLTARVWKPVVADQSVPSDLRETQERIHAAAIRMNDGTVHVGDFHPDCVYAAMDAGKFPGIKNYDELGDLIERGRLPDFEEGFVTSTGRFIGREEAARIGSASGQVDPTGLSAAEGWLDSHDVVHEAKPTDAQKEAGNYKKEHRRWEGFDISIENAKGSTRSGTSQGGETWSVKMPADYGYFRRTEGKDGDHVDCYLGDTEDAHYCYVVDQIDHESKKFDEHKCLICFPDLETALETYKKGFSDGKGEQRIGEVTTMTVEEFKDWLHDGNTTKPVAWKKTLKESVNDVHPAPMTESDDVKDWLLTMPELDHNVYSAVGQPIRKSRNLRGIRQHISRNLVNRVNIYPLGNHEGVMEVVFANGDYHRGRWASYDMIRHALRNWRNLYGATLFINGVPAGQVRYQNPKLMEADEAKDSILNSDLPAVGDPVEVVALPTDEYGSFNGTYLGLKNGHALVDGGDYGTWMVDLNQVRLLDETDKVNDEVKDFLERETPFKEEEKAEMVRALKGYADKVVVSDTRVVGHFKGDDRRDIYELTFGKENLNYWSEILHYQYWNDGSDPLLQLNQNVQSEPGESPYDFAGRVLELALA